MPYSGPSTTTTTATIGSRPGHRRSYSSSFSDEKGPGAFAPLGALPRRASGLRSTPTTPTSKVFHLKDDDDDDSSSSSEESTFSTTQHKRTPGFHEHHDHDDEEEEGRSLPPLKFKQQPTNTGAFRLHLNTKIHPTVHLGVPFPRSSPSPSPKSASPERINFPTPPPIEVVSQSPDPISSPMYPPSSPGYLAPSRPSYNRTSSNPILLANGKPLKSSLKSSASSPNVTLPAAIPQPEQRPIHLRARSEPATPRLDILSSSSSSSSSTASPLSTTASTPKNVHFSTTGLTTVKLFNKAAKPASLLGEETETETEGENSARSLWRNGGYPFPRVARTNNTKEETKFELELGSYPIPSSSHSPHANVHLESMMLTTSTVGNESLSLTGTVVVRNIAFEKNVFVRFTLDDWQTTSEVSAKHSASLTSLPPALLPRTFGDILSSNSNDQGWDRFTFSIRLEDYMRGLETKVIWMVGRFFAPQHGNEWWDNNGGRNYRVGFRKVPVAVSTPPAGSFSFSLPPVYEI